MTRDFSRFLARFGEVREDAAGYLVPCPAHDDQHPSLLLTLKDDGRLLVYCRAGCDRTAVLSALGLSDRDLFGWVPGGDVRVRAGGRTVADPGPAQIAALRVWLDTCRARWEQPDLMDLIGQGEDYLRDRYGVDIPTVERLGLGLSPCNTNDAFPYLSRTFRQYPRLVVPFHGFDGVARGAQGRDLSGQCRARWVSLTGPDDSSWAWARYGVFRGGYFDVWVITEGPSDGLTVAALGYDVVMVRGAGIAANPALADELAVGMRGRPVVIAGDNDRAGQRFVAQLGDALRARGVPVAHVTIPYEGADITDWRKRDLAAFPAAFHKAVRDASALAVAQETARTVRGRVLSRRTGMDAVTAEDGERAAEVYTAAQEQYGKTDAARAHALAAWLNGEVRYVPGLGYFAWNGRVWEPSEHRVRTLVHRMGAALALAGRGDDATGYLNTGKIDALLTELKAVPSVYTPASAFDARPALLTFRNCTVDLRTGEQRPHDMGDMLTHWVDTDYDPDATAPRWEQFLREIFPEHPELPLYLRRLIGYGITGFTSEQCFAVLWGKGANGKSVFTDTLTYVFRHVSRTTPFSTFEEKPSGGIPNDLAALRGARLVMASEGEAGRPMAEAVLKRATGSDVITARFLRKEFFEFKPQFLLLMATNHKPRFKGQDDGLWRRVKLIPFHRYFAPHERDYYLAETLRAEAPGIAAWAVRGAQEWFRMGLDDPPVIREATREYRETSDPLAGFFPGVLVPQPGGSVLGNIAYAKYLAWCEMENLPAKERWSRQAFYRAMEERGATRHKVAQGITLRGVAIDPHASL